MNKSIGIRSNSPVEDGWKVIICCKRSACGAEEVEFGELELEPEPEPKPELERFETDSQTFLSRVAMIECCEFFRYGRR